MLKKHKNKMVVCFLSFSILFSLATFNFVEATVIKASSKTIKTFLTHGNIVDVNEVDEKGKYKYNGGDQSWFEKESDQRTGCGTVAAANITTYLAINNTSLRALYNPDDDIFNINKDDYKKHMNDVLEYVQPSIIGIPTTDDLALYIQNYAKSRGISLKPHGLNKNHTFKSDVDYIKKGLKKGSPVAMINWYNPKLASINWTRPDENGNGDFQMHWVTITALIENKKTGEVTIKVSTWGGTAEISFNDCYNESYGKGGYMGIVYFDWNSAETPTPKGMGFLGTK